MGIKMFKPPRQNAYICSGNPLSMYSKKELLVGRDDCRFRSLLQFDLSSLPFNLTVIISTLNLFLFKNDKYFTSKSVDVHQILSQWCEKDVYWDNQPLFNATPVSSAVITDQLGVNISWDVTALVHNWYIGEPNLGVMLKMGDESVSNLVGFRSNCAKNSQIWPSLLINYLDTNGCCNIETIDIPYKELDTYNTFTYTNVVDLLIFNYTYIVENIGANAAEVVLKLSADGIRWQEDSLVMPVLPSQVISVMPNTVARFAKLGYRSQTPGSPTRLNVYLQGRTM